jgi:hypothetical protein
MLQPTERHCRVIDSVEHHHFPVVFGCWFVIESEMQSEMESERESDRMREESERRE